VQKAATRPAEEVLEVVAGKMLVPDVLGWLHLDASIQVLNGVSRETMLSWLECRSTSTWALGMFLFLTAFEIDVSRLRGSLGRAAGRAFAVSIFSVLPRPSCLAGSAPGTRPGFLMVVSVPRRLACSFPWPRAAIFPTVALKLVRAQATSAKPVELEPVT
jgi:hypothetical protein